MNKPNPPSTGAEILADDAPEIQTPNPLASRAPRLAGMTKAEKRAASLNALAALSALVDLAPDEIAMRKIAREEADKIRPTRLIIEDKAAGVRRDLGERLVHPKLGEIVAAVNARVPVLLIGPAGSGKTTLAENVADALGLDFYFAGAVGKKHELLGYRDGAGQIVRTAFRDAFERGGLFLFDEIDASIPGALLAVNAGLSNGWMDFPDGRIMAHPSFRFIGSANTNGTGASREYSGRNQLDASSTDRFGMLIEIEHDNGLTARIVSAIVPPELRGAALEWAAVVNDYREALADLGMRGVISPRAAIFGARLIAAGIKPDELPGPVILNRFASADDRKRLKDAAHKRIKLRHDAEARSQAEALSGMTDAQIAAEAKAAGAAGA